MGIQVRNNIIFSITRSHKSIIFFFHLIHFLKNIQMIRKARPLKPQHINSQQKEKKKRAKNLSIY